MLRESGSDSRHVGEGRSNHYRLALVHFHPSAVNRPGLECLKFLESRRVNLLELFQGQVFFAVQVEAQDMPRLSNR